MWRFRWVLPASLTRHRTHSENCAKQGAEGNKMPREATYKSFMAELNTQSTIGVSFWILPRVLLDTVASPDKRERYLLT